MAYSLKSTQGKLTPSRLKQIAGPKYFERGEKYFNQGAVTRLIEYDDTVSANVSGSYSSKYRVRLWVESNELYYDCSCPLGRDFSFCKHCVAVGLACYESDLLQPSNEFWLTPKPSKQPEAISVDNIQTYLQKQTKASLIELITEELIENETFHRKLLIQTARYLSRETIDLKLFRTILHDAIHLNDFVEYDAARQYVSRVREVVLCIGEFLNEGFTREAIHLSEYAIELIEDNYEQVEDGESLSNIVEWLETIHHDACAEANLAHHEQVDLAHRLAKWPGRELWGTFDNVETTYVDVLGKKELALFQQLDGAGV